MAKKKAAKKVVKTKASAKKAGGRRRAPARKASPKKVEAVPTRYGSITPHLVVRDAAGAIEFYKKAFGAKELSRMLGPDGKIIHAELLFGDSVVMLNDEMPGQKAPGSLGGSPVSLMFYHPDVDALFAQATAAGCTAPMGPPQDMFWGDRFANLIDPNGHLWGIATHTKDLTDEEMKKAAEEWFARMAQQQQQQQQEQQAEPPAPPAPGAPPPA